MNATRRSFLHRLAGAVGGAALAANWNTLSAKTLVEALDERRMLAPDILSTDETFWSLVRQAFPVSPNIINLNNGGVSPHPTVVQDALERYERMSNEAPSYYMWRILDQGREPLRAQLAGLAGCSPEEIAFNRNASEALETVIFGLRLKRGDEVVLTKQDYPNMINAWKQREHRDGIVLKWLDFELPIEDNDFIVKAFADAFTANTRVVHITHVINWTGQILPAQAIAQAAHKRGIEVLVDGAHSFAHFPYTIPELECDYFGTSLHKWLCAPIGAGMLYVKKDKIKQLYPLMGSPDPESADIRKFENLGTRSFPIEQAVGQAYHFHQMLGSERKGARLHYLKNYWMEQVKSLPGVKLHTSLDPRFGCAIGVFSVEGKKPEEVEAHLFNSHKIHTVAINWENIHVVRVTPHVYTMTYELDKLVQGIKQLVKS